MKRIPRVSWARKAAGLLRKQELCRNCWQWFTPAEKRWDVPAPSFVVQPY